MAMNTQRVALGGVAAGITIFLLDFLSNAFVLGERFMAELGTLNPSLPARAESMGALAGYAVVDVLIGIVIVWLYAAIRPTFGPGPKTAAIAAVYFWVATGIIWGSLVIMGVFSWTLYAMGAVIWLVIMLAGANVGGWLYRE